MVVAIFPRSNLFLCWFLFVIHGHSQATIFAIQFCTSARGILAGRTILDLAGFEERPLHFFVDADLECNILPLHVEKYTPVYPRYVANLVRKTC